MYIGYLLKCKNPPLTIYPYLFQSVKHVSVTINLHHMFARNCFKYKNCSLTDLNHLIQMGGIYQ